MNSLSIDPVAILAGALCAFFVGFLWYSPLLFGNIWMKLVGMKEHDMKKCMGITIFKGVLNTLFMTTLLALLMSFVTFESPRHLFIFLLFGWMAFMVYEGFGAIIWERKNCTLVAINTFHGLAAILSAGFVMYFMTY